MAKDNQWRFQHSCIIRYYYVICVFVVTLYLSPDKGYQRIGEHPMDKLNMAARQDKDVAQPSFP